MARAYICHARNDLGGHLLQVLDLKPNSSQPGNVTTPAFGGGVMGVQSGQTGYLSYGPDTSDVALTAIGGGAFVTSDVYDGLAAYLIDNVNDTNGNIALTAARANGIKDRILTRVAAGSALTLADLNQAIRDEGGVGAASTLDGTGGTRSTGSVVGVLRVLSGEVYRLPVASAVISAGGAFPWPGGIGPHVPAGSFLAMGTTGYRRVRRFYATGALAHSLLGGALSRLVSALFTWINPSFTYGAAGTALAQGGAHIATTGQAKAVTVYAVDGSIL